MSAPRVGLVGARRVRQGLGPFVARDLLRAGAVVPAFVATRASSLDAARSSLAEDLGIQARGFLELSEMLAREPLDAVAILSPAECHAEHLETAVAAGVHVLCEKPFVWDVPDLARRAGEIVDAFEARGLLLWENCQWPYTLSAFEALHPNALAAPPRRFEMLLQPTARGIQRLGDALPHALSLLQALVPGDDASVGEFAAAPWDAAAPSLELSFRYRASGHDIEARVTLEEAGTLPRSAWIAIDGRRARRVVKPPDYQLCFVDADRTVPVTDPLTRLVADFARELRSAAPSSAAREIRQRMQLLAELVDAFDRKDA